MSTNPDYKRYAVLYVDDELMALKYFEKTFGGEFKVLTADSAEEGMKLIESRGDEIGVLLSDQRMPGRLRRHGGRRDPRQRLSLHIKTHPGGGHAQHPAPRAGVLHGAP